MRLSFLLPAIAMLVPAAARADDAPCPPGVAASPRLDVAAQGHPVTAGTRDQGDTPLLVLGQAADVRLRPAATVAFAPPLAKPAAPADTGGIVAFRVEAAGLYRVLLGGHAWIDVVKAGVAVPSVAHARGVPGCTGIAKMVDFRLDAGAYQLALSATDAAALLVEIVRLP